MENSIFFICSAEKNVFAECILLRIEFYRWSFRSRFVRFKIRALLYAEQSSPDVFRKSADVSIQVLSGKIELSALLGNSVFGSFQLSLKVKKICICFQIGIFLGNN